MANLQDLTRWGPAVAWGQSWPRGGDGAPSCRRWIKDRGRGQPSIDFPIGAHVNVY